MQSAMGLLLFVCASVFVGSEAASVQEANQAASHANPIRKVVNMLQDMSTKVTAEGEKEQALFDKFMCYCKNNVGGLEASIAAAGDKSKSLQLALDSTGEKKKQTESDLKEHTASRDDAKDAMNKATAIRDKQAADFAKYQEDANTNIAAMGKAITAIDSGMGSFLQTPAAGTVRRYAMEKADVADETRKEVLSFLAGGQNNGYAPASGEISGILKQMKDTMAKDLSDATAAEDSAIKSYDALMATKKKEVDTLQAQIEVELNDVGDLGMKLAELANDLEETDAGFAEDNKFLAELKKGCKTKAAEWDEVKATRKAELQALADTIKILNDDDALELFKKTLPGASSSFVQIQEGAAAMRAAALSALRKAHARSPRSMHLGPRPNYDLIELALNGRQKGFDKVVAMIDSMTKNLKREQVDDDTKKAYCDKSFDETEDKKKGLEGKISDSELKIEDTTGAIATLTSELKALEDGIAALDKAVAEATEQRKEESADYEALVSSDTAAKELLLFAKNRLNKFYNPKLYKAPPKEELSSEGRIVASFSLVQIREHSQNEDDAAPPPPPETFGPYSKKKDESSGVIAMIDLLVGDIDKELQQSKVDEDNAQEEYEALMKDSGDKRKQDSEAVTEKSSAKARAEETLETEKQSKADSGTELMATDKEIYALHGECDWLLKFYDVRKDARTGEIDALGKAKAVLSGADYSLLQTRSLRR